MQLTKPRIFLKGFCHNWRWGNLGHVTQMRWINFVPPAHGGSIWNLALFAPAVSEDKMFEECGWRMTEGRTTDKGAFLYYTLTNEPKGSGELKCIQFSKRRALRWVTCWMATSRTTMKTLQFIRFSRECCFVLPFHMNRGTWCPTRFHFRLAKNRISLPICFWSLATHRVPCDDSNQTARMR